MDIKPIRIKFYRYEDDPNVAPLESSDFGGKIGPFEGQWAIMKILHDYFDHMYSKGQIQIRLPVPDKDENGKQVKKQLYLKPEFFHDKECRESIPNFVQALLSKE